ncbi:ATP-binding protein [Sphingomonas crusticola]|uniref:BbrUII/HgiDII family restriction enzyme n=1 Tax=Sphingomonas crusticola TaxID=1697973 RepID=UPI000E22CCB1|nr:ATP-binding protein [Sphingomonas crusticola]
MSVKRKLEMTISLNALEHLGINLYSNIPAVLSEIVANAWDADATKVSISIDKANGTITIEDNGTGMDRDGVIDRFLTVGFKRREQLGEKTPLGRLPMGRKGIGKLSIFSVAQVAEVFTTLHGEKTAFRMDREVIRKAIAGKGKDNYEPEELSTWPKDLKAGTRIVLSKTSKSLSGMTAEGLRRRVARRFSVIGSKSNFDVSVDGHKIGPEDRAYHNVVQYLWTYGDQSAFTKTCKHLERSAEARLTAVNAELKKAGLTLTGWIGTVAKPDQLKDEEGDNLNRIAIFMRGKLAQEDVLDEFGQKEIYADYIIGELHCEQLDLDTDGDIATSSRQALKQDDPRFEALRRIILSELRYIAGKWSDWRRTDGAKAAATVPAVSAWLANLQGETKKRAERWIGRLNTIRSNNDEEKKELLKASILAFESYRRKEELDRLDNIKDENLDEILAIFENIDDLELSYYGQIVKLRVGIITALQNKLKANDKELVLRDYIFEHLWLLDPSWERTKGTEHAETLVEKFLEDNTKSLKGAAKAGRIDIGYRTANGKHIIVELKRASVVVPVDELMAQIRKYRDGARKILDKTAFKGWPIEIICLLGKEPPEYKEATGAKGVADTLKTVDARIVFYDELLTNAQQAYADYLEAHVKVDKLWGVFEAIDDFTPPPKALPAAAPIRALPSPATKAKARSAAKAK